MVLDPQKTKHSAADYIRYLSAICCTVTTLYTSLDDIGKHLNVNSMVF